MKHKISKPIRTVLDVLCVDQSEITPDSGPFHICDQVLVGALKGSLGRDRVCC